MRLFVAAVLPEEMLEALAETSARLRGAVRGRYVAPDSFHVTLAFLGEVEGYRSGDAADAVRAGCAATSPFEASLGELGKFGKRSCATLWQGLRDEGELSSLAESVRAELKRAGFTFDAKAFLPHITLMRKADLTSGALPMPVCAWGEIAEVALYSSDLSGVRPHYEVLEAVVLGE